MSKKAGKAEIIALLIYVVGLTVLAFFHEPWFDEAQAWQIARSASIKEILFEIPHYEGHPPLWHLLLVPFAKLGAPFDLSIKAINIIFCTVAMSLLLWKSPFPKIVRCLLPFNFFFFYQYGVMSRPYSVMMLAVFLAAITYARRNERPMRYILSLILICLTSAYGLLIAGGLCAVWTVEIAAEMIRKKEVRRVLRDPRFRSLCFILIVALLLVLTILPAENCYYGGRDVEKTFVEVFAGAVKCIGMIPYNSWMGTYMNYTYEIATQAGYLIDLLGGLVCWTLLIIVMRRNRKLFTFLTPYLILCCFFAFKYASAHHIGISTLFHVFMFWIVAASPEGFQTPECFLRLSAAVKSGVVRKFAAASLAFACLTPIIYSAVSSYHEVRLMYGPTYFAEFIKEHSLEDTKIMTTWSYRSEEPEEDDKTVALMPTHYMPAPYLPIEAHYTYVSGLPVVVFPYFDEYSGFFMNFNTDCPEDLYVHYQYTDDVEETFASWEAQGLPDFIFDYCPLAEIYDEQTLEGVKYVCIEEFKMHKFFKLAVNEGIQRIYIRDDLLDEYPQFTPIQY